MTTQSALLAKENLYEELMESATELRTLLMVMRNVFIELAKDRDKMSLERSLEQIASIEEMLPTDLIDCLRRYGARPGEGGAGAFCARRNVKCRVN